ncbi:hypothetical protein [Sediminicola luteus]|nr:hypothetical protein [Sediminicola luteus]
MKPLRMKPGPKPLSAEYLATLMFLGFLGACSSNDPQVQETPIQFQYASDSMVVRLASAGTIPKPEMEWSGNTGSFSLVGNLDGLEIDSETGAIEWTRDLPIGHNTVLVNAVNDQGNWHTGFVLTKSVENSLWAVSYAEHDKPETEAATYYLRLGYDNQLQVLPLDDPENPIGKGIWQQVEDAVVMQFCDDCPEITPKAVLERPSFLLVEATARNDSPFYFMRGKLYNYSTANSSKTFSKNCYLGFD